MKTARSVVVLSVALIACHVDVPPSSNDDAGDSSAVDSSLSDSRVDAPEEDATTDATTDSAPPAEGGDAGDAPTDSAVPVDGGDAGDAPTDSAATADGDAAGDAPTDSAAPEDGDDAGDASTADGDASEDTDTGLEDAETGAGDATTDAGPIWVVASCTLAAAGPTNGTVIDSAGNWYAGRISAGALVGAAPANATPLAPADLSALLAAAASLDASDAGYTTSVGPQFHQTNRFGTFNSAGAPGQTTLVELWTDGASFGQRTVKTNNDPATSEILKYICFHPD